MIEKVILRRQKFVPATCCITFSWSEFVCHEAGTKWLKFSMSHSLHCSCKLSPLNIEMNQCPFRVHQLAYCLCNRRAMRTHEGALRPRNMSPTVLVPTFNVTVYMSRMRVRQGFHLLGWWLIAACWSMFQNITVPEQKKNTVRSKQVKKKTLRDGLHSSEKPIKGAKEKTSKMENVSKTELQSVQDAG